MLACSSGPTHLSTVPQGAGCRRLLVVVDGNTVCVAVGHPALLNRTARRQLRLLHQLLVLAHARFAAGEGVIQLPCTLGTLQVDRTTQCSGTHHRDVW